MDPLITLGRNDGDFIPVPTIPPIAFTTTKTEVCVMLTGSGVCISDLLFANVYSVCFRVTRSINGSPFVSIGGTNVIVQNGRACHWSCSFSKRDNVSINDVVAYQLEYRTFGLLISIFVAMRFFDIDAHHLTLTIIE
uniref:Uncharacterized protein n=1 Tax=Mimivirus LCMiAC02 TaxID=2506609 RepID=A0A4P6VLR3_9VIRU|nr:MAG: hypothetical protein LCMiAC02_04770 [Mimivirus LCMiAC02]